MSDQLTWAEGLKRFARVVGFGLLCTAFLAFVGFLAIPRLIGVNTPEIFADVRANYVKYEVTRSRLSALALRDVLLIRPAAECGAPNDRSMTALVTPPTGAEVEYFSLPDFVQVTIRAEGSDAPILVDIEGQPECSITGVLTVLIPLESVQKNQPLPILGSVEIGRELGVPTRPTPGDLRVVLNGGLIVDRPASNVLLGGNAWVFGRSSDRWDGGRLYPVGEAIPILRGTRLSFESGETVAGNVMRTEADSAFNIQFTVSVANLKIHRPGQENQVESLAVGSISRAFGDPTLAPLLISLAVASFIINLAFGFFALSRDIRRND
ncbi:MAG: hypothetical protein AAF813_07580 [Pseudomonadota bacterium]